MSMLWDKKKAFGTMIAKRKEGGGPKEVGPAAMQNEVIKDEHGEIDGRHLASQDMIAAMDERSAEKMMRALANFMDLHNSQPEKADPREE